MTLTLEYEHRVNMNYQAKHQNLRGHFVRVIVRTARQADRQTDRQTDTRTPIYCYTRPVAILRQFLHTTKLYPQCITQFCHDMQLVSSDYTRLTDVFTYCSDDGLRQSWIDHVVCSASLDNLIESVLVMNDII